MNPEIEEIIAYLNNRKNYLIWAGFAQHAHLGLKCSSDIDIFTKTLDAAKDISSHFQDKGWKKMPHGDTYKNWDKLEKNRTTFDIIHSRNAEMFFRDGVEIEVGGYLLNFISKEVLFLTKLGQLRARDRTDEKRRRDLKVVNLLSEVIDVEKVKEIASKLPDSYWRTGWV